jgi:hypothetical protein
LTGIEQFKLDICDLHFRQLHANSSPGDSLLPIPGSSSLFAEALHINLAKGMPWPE